jgi:hypothetical protein
MMNFSDLDVTTAGINFSVQPTYRFGDHRTLKTRPCYISNETLGELASMWHSRSFLPEEIFRHYEREITATAMRLALAVVNGTPLVVRIGNFPQIGR